MAPASMLILVAVTACTSVAPMPAHEAGRIPEGLFASPEAPFEPIPRDMALDPTKVLLGERLFAEPALSGDGERACTDCHDLGKGGVVPGETRSNHPDNATGPYNVPTVFNVAFNFRYNWRGNYETLEDHLGGPMMSPIVMDAGSWPALLDRLRPSYSTAFLEAGYAGLDEHAVRDALAIYQRSLTTPDSAFDRFLRGEHTLTAAEHQGYTLFREAGCSSCHQGINLGGNLFQRFGVFEDAFRGRPLTEADYGRLQVTGEEADAFVFRVPSLRNIALTAPYFHDGSAPTLPDAVRHMAKVQLGLVLSDEEVDHLVAFLKTLTGTYRRTPPSGQP